MPARDGRGRFTKGPIVVDPEGFRMTILNIQKLGISVDVAARAALQAAGAVLLHQVRSNASRTDHTLDQLADLDHPYARRHGRIQVQKLGSAFQARPWLVHTRTGAFLSAMRGRTLPAAQGYDVYAAPTAPWVRDVILGTRVMLPRDILWYTAHERPTKVAMMRAVVTVLGKGLRTQAIVRFD